jgi:hypothetical protein
MQITFFLAVAASCVVIYWLLIRPKLHAMEMFDPHLDRADERYARWWATLRGWRVEAWSFIAIFVLELPDLIDFIAGANVVEYLPLEYQRPAQMALLVLAFVRAFVTKRSAEKKLEDADAVDH